MSLIQSGAVMDFPAIFFSHRFKRPPSRTVVVKPAEDFGIAFQKRNGSAGIGDGIEDYMILSGTYAEFQSGKVVDETLIHIADGRAGQDKRDILRGDAALEKAVPEFVPSAAVPERHGEIPFPSCRVPDLTAGTDCYTPADATAFEVVQKRGGLQRTDLNILEAGFIPSMNGERMFFSRLPYFRKRKTGDFRHIFRLPYKIVRAEHFPGEGEYVASFSRPEVIPETFGGVHLERCRPFVPVR